MKLPLELRYALLISFSMLLWLAVETLVGLHDKYINLHPIVTMFALLIPIVFSRMAVKEKKDQLGGEISFKQALITGLIITSITALLAVPSQIIFHKWINPDFFDNMIAAAVAHGQSATEASKYFNLTSYMVQSAFGTLLFGSVIALIVAFVMRTKSK